MKRLILSILLAVGLVGSASAAALTQYCAWSVMGAGNANYGGVFDPSVVSGASGVLANLASTSSSSTTPTFSSVGGYIFVAGDVGNWVFVAAGASWQVGLYKITSITGSTNAIVDAAIGHVILWNSTTGVWSLSTVAGCGATASGTFSVCYSGPGQTADNFTDATFSGAGTAAIGNTSAVFTPVMIGNGLHITAGTGATVGWYTLTGYTSTTAMNINVSPGTGTLWTAYVGGAINLIDTINSAVAGLGPVAGNQIFLSGSFSQTNTVTWANIGTAAAPLLFQGYVTYWSDANTNFSRANGSGAISTTGMPLLTLTSSKNFTFNAGYNIFDWLNITGTASTYIVEGTGSFMATRCVITSSNTGGITVTPGGGVIFNCDILETGATGTSPGLALTTSGGPIVGNRIVISSPTGIGLTMTLGGPCIVGNQFIGPGKATATAGSAGINTTNVAGRVQAIGNTIVGFYDDVNVITGSTAVHFLANNMLTDSSNFGINGVSTSTAIVSAYNRTGNNTNGAYGNMGTWFNYTNYGAVTSWSTSDYQNVTTDLRLLSTSPAVGAAWPPLGSIGALQLSQTGSAGQTASAYSQ